MYIFQFFPTLYSGNRDFFWLNYCRKSYVLPKPPRFRFCTSKQSFGYLFLDLARWVFVEVFVCDLPKTKIWLERVFGGPRSVTANIGSAVDSDLHEKPLHRIGSTVVSIPCRIESMIFFSSIIFLLSIQNEFFVHSKWLLLILHGVMSSKIESTWCTLKLNSQIKPFYVTCVNSRYIESCIATRTKNGLEFWQS